MARRAATGYGVMHVKQVVPTRDAAETTVVFAGA